MECSPLAISLGLLLITTTVLSEITIDLNYDKNTLTKKYDVKGNINLYCTVVGTAKESFSVKWERENKEIKDTGDRVVLTRVDNSHKLRVNKAAETDAGMYSCVAYSGSEELGRKNITLYSNYRVKTPDNMNFVEGEIIRIPCQVHGRPAPEISWEVGNETYSESRDRVILERDEEKDIDNAIFIIKEASMDDRGMFRCVGLSSAGDRVSHETMVRIKDKYAALWPFLGICAEVFILCAIILIYEKKRNKAELEESDTDQSPDQKNTPDHGKDSNLRHRQ